MRLDLPEVHELGPLGRRVERHHGVPHEARISVRLEPGERLRRRSGLVDAATRHDYDRIRPTECRAHHGVHDTGAAVGEHQGVVLCGEVRDDVVVMVVERLGAVRIRVGGDHIEPRGIARDHLRELSEAAEPIRPLDDVLDGVARRLRDPLGKGATVRIRVDRDDSILPGARQRHPEQGRHGRLADASFTGEHRDVSRSAVEHLRDPRVECGLCPGWPGVAQAHRATRPSVEPAPPESLRRDPERSRTREETIGRQLVGAFGRCAVVSAPCAEPQLPRRQRLIIDVVGGRRLPQEPDIPAFGRIDRLISDDTDRSGAGSTYRGDCRIDGHLVERDRPLVGGHDPAGRRRQLDRCGHDGCAGPGAGGRAWDDGARLHVAHECVPVVAGLACFGHRWPPARFGPRGFECCAGTAQGTQPTHGARPA